MSTPTSTAWKSTPGARRGTLYTPKKAADFFMREFSTRGAFVEWKGRDKLNPAGMELFSTSEPWVRGGGQDTTYH